MEDFFQLTPDKILDSVEAALSSPQRSVRATGRTMALNSVENRVYEVELEDGESVVTKFYRPSRWTPQQILEEHQVLKKLSQAEIPVVAPLPLNHHSNLSSLQGETLAETNTQILFSVFPKVRGRILDELNDEQVRKIGRFLGRIHAITETFTQSSRIELNIEQYLEKPTQILSQSPKMDNSTFSRYEQICSMIREKIEPHFLKAKKHLIHGDCHLGNVLWTPDDQPFFLDFDDMVIGPPVQDFWMIVRGRDDHAKKQRDELFQAYELFHPFDSASFRLIEPLRALRLIHYSGWIAKRWNDPSFPKLFPSFGSNLYWREEMEELLQTLEAIPI